MALLRSVSASSSRSRLYSAQSPGMEREREKVRREPALAQDDSQAGDHCFFRVQPECLFQSLADCPQHVGIGVMACLGDRLRPLRRRGGLAGTGPDDFAKCPVQRDSGVGAQ